MSRRSTSRRGFTLLELLIAVAASGILVAGMTSSMFIALRATDKSSTPADATLQAGRVLTQMALDLRDAISLATESPTAIAAYVPDRNGDLNAELIQYTWSGTAGDKLYRVYTDNISIPLVDDVHEFLIEYSVSPAGKKYVNVKLQVSDNSTARVETAFLLENL